MIKLPSYWKSVNIGDPKLQDFFKGSLLRIEEKVDGSQFSFGKINDELLFRSKNASIQIDTIPKLFKKSVDFVIANQHNLVDNIIYRGEAITSLKHNANLYNRTPDGFVVLYGAENYITGEIYNHTMINNLANKLGIESIPVLNVIEPDTYSLEELYEIFKSYLQGESFLGGSKEGIVIKRIESPIYFQDRIIFAKFVSEAFREINKSNWKLTNPNSTDRITTIAKEIGNSQRYEKAIQKLKELELYDGSVRDIGPLMKAVSEDVDEECTEYIKERLFELFKKDIKRQVVNGIPNWYKEKLIQNSIQENGEE